MQKKETQPDGRMDCIPDGRPSEDTTAAGSTSEPDPWKHLVVGIPASRGQIYFGVVPAASKLTWAVWASVHGSEPEILSAWLRSEDADAAVARYVAALSMGWQRLQEEVRRSPSIAGYMVPGSIAPGVRDVLRSLVARKAR